MPELPYTFANLLGQDRARRLLARAVAHGRLAHAYLFRGPDGVGKKRAAITLGAWLNCLAPGLRDACGQCASCRRFASASHPDLKIIRPDGAAIKIEQVRQLKQELTFAPFEAPWRVVVLEDVHTMRREAANSLLKTLEEPPAGNILILTADEAGGLLPTIVSRCQQVAFHALRPDEVAQLLAASAGVAEETALTLAALADGSPGQAQLLLDLNLLPLRREVAESLLSLEPGTPEAIATVFALAEKAAALKEHMAFFLGLLKIWLRDLLLLAAGGPEHALVNRDLAGLLAAAGHRWSGPQLTRKLQLVRQAEKQLARNCNRSLVCEVLLLNLI